MNIVTVVQARTQSSRLPNKTLLPILGKPLLFRMLERVCSAQRIGQVWVATTEEPADDPILEIAGSLGLPVFRGSTDDCLDRHFQLARQAQADVVVKIPSDCPLISPSIIDRVLERFLLGNFDFVSNLHPASYPDGNDVEVMSFPALMRAWKGARRTLEREHTTPYIWERGDLFRLENVLWEEGKDLSMSHRWTIDYAEDYQMIQTVFEELYPQNPRFEFREILDLLNQKPAIHEMNAQYAGVNWYRNHLDELKTIQPHQTKTVERVTKERLESERPYAGKN